MFTITRFHYIEVLSLIFYNWGEEFCLLYCRLYYVALGSLVEAPLNTISSLILLFEEANLKKG